MVAAPIASAGNAAAPAMPPSAAGTAAHARTHTLKAVGGAAQMGAPFAPGKWNRARLTKMPKAAPTDGEIAAAGGLQEWEVQQGLQERSDETFEGKDNRGLTKLVDLPLAQSQSHIQFAGNEGDVAVAVEGALVYNDGIWDAITVECWVKDMKIGEHSGYVSALNSDPTFGAKHFGFMLGTYKSQFAFGIGAGDNTEMDYVMAPDWLTMPNEGIWTHLAGTYDAEDGMKLYINGLFVGCAKTISGPIEFPSEGAPQGSVDVVMGGLIGGMTDEATGTVSESSFVTGNIDEVRIWSVTRAQEDIFAFMHRTVRDEFLGPLPEGLELYWRFDFDVIACDPEYAWLPCHFTCDEVHQYKAHMMTHDAAKKGVELMPSDVPVETLTLARGCQKCPPYPEVEYGTWTPTYSVGAGDHVEITCDDGFRSKPLGENGEGSVSPECQFDMTFTPGVQCVALCAPLDAPPHGSIAPTGKVEMFDWVTMNCDEGYEAVGIRYVMCRPNHEYLFDHGTCVAICPAYPIVEHGTVTRNSDRYSEDNANRAGESVSVTCDEGYVLTFDSNQVATCGDGGEYDFPSATCLPVCSAHPEVANGEVSVTGPTILGDEVQITCNENYELAFPEMASVVCQPSHAYTQPWIAKAPTKHNGVFSHCVAVCPPYPYVMDSTITVDGSWEAADEPVREGSKIQVTCDQGFNPGLYNGGHPTATCVDDGKGGGGVYDPPECTPLGALSPKPWIGYDACTPARCLAPIVPDPTPSPPEPTPPPPDPDMVGDWGLNIRCSDFRDKALYFAEAKQITFLTQCMQQDCVQSLEGNNPSKSNEVGCRYTDANGFCYHSGATQMWCKDNSDDERCIDGGAAWAIPALGTSPGTPSAWMPVANYPLRGAAKQSGKVVSCSCMKNCGCTIKSKESKCFCTNKEQQITGVGPWVPDRIIEKGKDGECACVCVAGEAVSAEPVVMPPPDNMVDIIVVSGGEDSTESEGVEEMSPPPPPRSEPAGGWGLNIRCADWRDKADTFAEAKQITFLTECMQQDCVQSLEGNNPSKSNEVGCRYTDANGFCYHSGATQMWCKDNSDDDRCIDGGAAWATPALGSAPAAPSSWMPVANYPMRGAAKESGKVVSCSCMKNCGCTIKRKESKCFCTDKEQETAGAGPWAPDRIIKKNKDGECACVCVAGDAVVAGPGVMQPPEVTDITVVSGGGEYTESEGMEKITGGGSEVFTAPEPIVMAPPVITLPPPPPMDIDDAVGAALCVKDKSYPHECKSLLNIRCADWRDLAHVWAPAKQQSFYASCMAQDCVQSLEGGESNRPDQPGCRFLDGNGFCYAYGTAQMWCAGRGIDTPWCNDGGASWGLAAAGLGSAEQKPTEWTPHGDVKYRGQWADDAPYSCSCMKDCTCQALKKCWCVDDEQLETGPADHYAGTRLIKSSSKKGNCSCRCGDQSNG